MDVFRFIGILFVFGAPAIIGGGLMYDLFHNWPVVGVFEVFLVCGAVATARNACKSSSPSHHH